MLMKLIVLLALLVIVYCLGSGLFHLVREGRDSVKMARALTWRIVLSLSLFVLLLLAYGFGWIVPHGLVIPVQVPQ